MRNGCCPPFKIPYGVFSCFLGSQVWHAPLITGKGNMDLWRPHSVDGLDLLISWTLTNSPMSWFSCFAKVDIKVLGIRWLVHSHTAKWGGGRQQWNSDMWPLSTMSLAQDPQRPNHSQDGGMEGGGYGDVMWWAQVMFIHFLMILLMSLEWRPWHHVVLSLGHSFPL